MKHILLAMLFTLIPAKPPKINANDMRSFVGSSRSTILWIVHLEARPGMWDPEDGAPEREVAAFSEAGQRMQNPGPLMRVKQGVTLRVMLYNRSTVPVWIFGFADSVYIRPNGKERVDFIASKPGVYPYYAKTRSASLADRDEYDKQLNGMIVVDAPPYDRDDRLFVISTSGSTVMVNGRAQLPKLDLKAGSKHRLRVLNMGSAPATVSVGDAAPPLQLEVGQAGELAFTATNNSKLEIVTLSPGPNRHE
ncbi:MAG TPA: hypothetical protein VM100_00610 [Longimicrobiales bacterium]|nr:hypothetical protein [Longimicrobiales bacterium]